MSIVTGTKGSSNSFGLTIDYYDSTDLLPYEDVGQLTNGKLNMIRMYYPEYTGALVTEDWQFSTKFVTLKL